MPTFLSPEWIQALDDAGSDGTGRAPTAPGADPVLTIEQRVTTPGEDDVSYVVVLYDDDIRVLPGTGVEADVTFVVDRETAARIARGELSAQAAFMSGALRLVGEAAALLRSQVALAGLADRFAAVRADTVW